MPDKPSRFRPDLFALFFLFACTAFAQRTPGNITGNVFIVGNFNGSVNAEYQSRMKSAIKEQQGPVTIVYCGDLLNEKEKIPSASDSAFIQSLLEISTADSNVSIYFVP